MNKSTPDIKTPLRSRPLSQRFSLGYFKNAPETPGVYLMFNGQHKLLYAGKTSQLKKRLLTYRRISENDVSPYFYQMICQISHIRWQECESESSAQSLVEQICKKESPPFNLSRSLFGPFLYIDSLITHEGFKFQLSPHLKSRLGGTTFGAYPKEPITAEFFSAFLRVCWRTFNKGGEETIPEPLRKQQNIKAFGFKHSDDSSSNKRLQGNLLLIERFLRGESDLLLLKTKPTSTDSFFDQWAMKDWVTINHYFQEVLQKINKTCSFFDLPKNRPVEPHWQYSFLLTQLGGKSPNPTCSKTFPFSDLSC